jgi:hypothetical protein
MSVDYQYTKKSLKFNPVKFRQFQFTPDRSLLNQTSVQTRYIMNDQMNSATVSNMIAHREETKSLFPTEKSLSMTSMRLSMPSQRLLKQLKTSIEYESARFRSPGSKKT